MGLFDMHGNVWEWVQRLEGELFSGAQTDLKGPASGSYRVKRGGSWARGTHLRSAMAAVFYLPGNIGCHSASVSVSKQSSQTRRIPNWNSYRIRNRNSLPRPSLVGPGVEAHDARDGNITDQIVVTGSVDMNSTGTYLLTYSVQDAAGNPPPPPAPSRWWATAPWI